MCDPPSKHACVKTDASMIDITGIQNQAFTLLLWLEYFKKNAKAHIFRYRLEMFLYLLYTTKEHVTLRLLEQACSDSLQSNKAHGKAIALLL